jgi:very-short-patch-repair endonuclease
MACSAKSALPTWSSARKTGWRESFWFRKIVNYHVDFVICDPTTTAPLLVVELDDRRHRERNRKRQDDFKNAVLQTAGLPIYRIAAQAAYDPLELKQQIEKMITARP